MKLETKVGAFFAGSIAVIGILIFSVEKIQLGGNGGQPEFETFFGQVAGLNPQSQVRVAGVKVGAVRKITLDHGKAKVVLALRPDLPVYKDATASLVSIGILGEKYIELDQGHESAGLMDPGSAIASKTGIGLDNLMETLGEIGKDVKGVTYALNQSIGGESGRQKLDEIVDNVRQLTGELRAMAAENRPAIAHTTANVEAITGDLKDRLPKLTAQFEQVGKQLNELLAENRPELKGLIADTHKLAQSFNGTAENLKTLTDKINRGEGTVGKLLNDDTTIKKINEAVDSVNSMLGGFKAMDLRLDMGGSQWVDRHDSRIGLGIELAPRPDYWYALDLASTPDGKISESQQTVTKIDPVSGLPTTVLLNNRTVTVDKAFTISAQFAKRYGPVVFSAGIVESKGGAGLEFRTFEDRFRFGVLAYDFTKRDDKPNPRVRLSTTYQFWKGMYVQAGLQDVANKELRTLTFGGGIRWKDDDLKKLIGLAAGAK
ncbi:MAG TPA: MlaD family protein [Holophagaceae bacterium]|nr:MlaD family protein [Holophagaceae bacterium]